MFSKSSVCAVVALAAFMSLGALLFPQVGQAQECIWDCDLGSDFLNTPADNSPGFSIAYCFDQPCVASLKDSNGNPIFAVNIPNASVKQSADPDTCDGITPVTITISGNVVAVLKDKNGNLNPLSAAEASLSIVVKKVVCSPDSTVNPPSSILKRVLTLGEPPGDVFAVDSNIIKDSHITILAHSSQLGLDSPNWGGTGCPTTKAGILSANCSFKLGIDVSKTENELLAKFPAFGIFLAKEVYRGIGVGRVVAMRMCKGDANKPSSSIACTVGGDVAVGGFVADAVFNFAGNWSGSGDKTFNPKSSTGPFDIGPTPLFDDIVFTDPAHPVTASANGGTPIPPNGCNTIDNQQTVRCFFPAKDLLPNGCKTGQTVNIVVSGNVSFADNPLGFVKFLSTDSPTCNVK